MPTSESHADEVRRLRNTMRDLVALSTLPAVWAGYAPEGVAGSLADILLNTLALDLIYVRAGDVEIARGKGLKSDQFQAVAATLAPWLPPGEHPTSVIDPLHGRELRVAVARFGHTGDEGAVVACSHRRDFPTEADRLLLGVGTNQTAIVLQRKRAERTLAAQAQRLHITLSSIGDAVIATDAEGRVTFMNGVAESLTGWNQAEAMGRPLSDVFRIVNEHTRQPVENPALRALREGVIMGLANHTILIARDGTERPIDDSAAPIHDGPGKLSGAVLVFRDISKRKQAEQELRRKEAELTDFVENATVGLHWVGPDGTILWANQAEMDLLGYTREEYIGHNIAEFHADARVIEDILCRLTNRQELHGYEARLRGKDGSIKHVSINSSVLWEGDRFVHTRCFTRDVTERKQAEEDRARLAAIVESSEDAIISKDLNGTILSWNAGAERLFGYTADEAIGRSITLLIPPERQEEERAILDRLRRGERVEHFETVRVSRAGRLIDISLTISPVRNAEGHVVGASKVARDITERKEAEAVLRDADRKKDEFIALLAHELRNPLAPIRNGLQVMRLALGDGNTRVAQARDMMDRQLSHMVRLIDDLLDVSRINRNKMELRRSRVLLADVLSSAVETARPLIDAAGHELTVSLPQSPVHLDADLTRLAQVFSNLLTNSAKYTQRGGRIWLSAERRGAEVVVSVRDTGIGIPASSLGNIFDMFSQVDRSIERSTGGLGIGLALVKGLVEMHDGTVMAASEGQGRGSTFTVTLPALMAQPEAVPAATSENGSAVSGPRRRILVVDDNRDGAESLAMLLRLMNNEVRTAHDGLEAIEQAEAFRPEIVLMDVGMPRLNGLDATRRLRGRDGGRHMKIIALTGWGQDADKERSREAGCDGHLTKPVNMDDLAKLLGEVREG